MFAIFWPSAKLLKVFKKKNSYDVVEKIIMLSIAGDYQSWSVLSFLIKC